MTFYFIEQTFHFGSSSKKELAELIEKAKVLSTDEWGKLFGWEGYHLGYPNEEVRNKYEKITPDDLENRTCRELVEKTGLTPEEVINFRSALWELAYDLGGDFRENMYKVTENCSCNFGKHIKCGITYLSGQVMY